MSDHNDALVLINRLVKKFGKGGYVFRGTAKCYSEQEGEGGILDGINSTLYRWYVKEKTEEDSAENEDPSERVIMGDDYFPPEVIEAEIVKNARKMFASNTATHEILTDLQHFGGKTNMMDFTRNMYIALFFACQSNYDESGELIALHTDKLKKIDEVVYKVPITKGKMEIIEPASAQSSRQRVHSQSSVFVRPTDGYIKPELCEITKISTDLKASISKYLETFHNITANTIYNDLYGFISNEKNNETISLYLYLGLANCKKKQYEKALKYLNECLKHNPPMPVAYNNRGVIHFVKNDYIPAIKDYDMAINLKRDYMEAFYNRGNAHVANNDHESAIKDYEQVLLFNAEHADAYFGLGDAYVAWEKYERGIQEYGKAISHRDNFAKAYNARGVAFGKWYKSIIKNSQKMGYAENSGKDKLECAIKDFDMAIQLDPNFALSYFNRGMTKIEKGDKKDGEKDLAMAFRLGYKPPVS